MMPPNVQEQVVERLGQWRQRRWLKLKLSQIALRAVLGKKGSRRELCQGV